MASRISHMFHCLPIALCTLLWGCSVQLTQGDIGTGAGAIPCRIHRKRLNFYRRNLDTLRLSQDLVAEYNSAAPAELYPREQCLGNAKILAQVQQNGDASAWTIPLVVLPFWPIQPVDETWTYKLQVQILCDGSVVKQAEFTEEETIRATLYGKLRSDLLNEASRDMQRKLVHRLAFDLDNRNNADLNCSSDY